MGSGELSTAPDADSTREGRQWRRRARTRAKLVAAAGEIVAARGPAGLTMAEVSARAELAAGTVYNYFPAVEELLNTVIREQIESVGERLDRVAGHTDDPAEIYASSLRLLVRHALADPLWGRFYVHLGVAHPIVLEVLGPRCRRDLELGLKRGQIDVEDLDLAVTCTFGALASAIHRVDAVGGGEGLADRFAERMLRMVGLGRAEAADVISRPLPSLS